MKKNLLYYVFGCMALGLILSMTACKKKKAFRDEDGQASVDNKNVMGENDAAIGDVNDVIGDQPLLHGRNGSTSGTSGVTGNACGLAVDTNGLSKGSVTLIYNGTTCRNRTRTGKIKLTILDYVNGKRWKNTGCQLKIEYMDYKIARASDGNSMELNGMQTITNETGGTWWDLLIMKTQTSLSSTIKGTGLEVTFEDGKTASYNINRRITYSLPGGILTCQADGIGSLNGRENLENYGLTRDGDEFTSQVISPIVWNLTCGSWAPVQGEMDVKVDKKAFSLKVLYSVDAGGNAQVSSPNSCAYGWKVEWSYKKKTKKKIIPYY